MAPSQCTTIILPLFDSAKINPAAHIFRAEVFTAGGKFMRRVVVFLVLAATAASAGGCVTSTDSIAEKGTPGATGSNGSGSTAGGGGTDPSAGLAGSTSGTGGPNAATLASGDKALAFAPTGRSPTSGGLARLSFANPGTAGETASVTIDPKNTLGFGGPTGLGLYHRDANGLKDADLQTSAAGYRPPDYGEYRKITTETDEELQYWKFTDANGTMTSYAAQYRNVTKGGTKEAQAAWFFGGNATPAAALPTSGPSATYQGAFAATATADNWIKPDGWDYDPSGSWRLRGNSAITADFAAAKIDGTLTPTYWEKFDGGKVVQVTAGAASARSSTMPTSCSRATSRAMASPARAICSATKPASGSPPKSPISSMATTRCMAASTAPRPTTSPACSPLMHGCRRPAVPAQASMTTAAAASTCRACSMPNAWRTA